MSLPPPPPFLVILKYFQPQPLRTPLPSLALSCLSALEECLVKYVLCVKFTLILLIYLI